MEVSIVQPWSEFVMKGVLPKELISKLIELTDIITQDAQKVSYSNTLAGEIKDEWEIDPPLLVNIKLQSFLYKLLEEYIQIIKTQSRPKGTNLEEFPNLPSSHFSFLDSFSEWVLESAWFNDQKDNEYNPLHNHGGILSGVLYLKIPEYLPPRQKKNTDGAITFVGNTVAQEGLLTIPQFSILPEEGDIFIFPASLRHQVYPFRTENGQGIRRSMSFNINIPQRGSGIPLNNLNN